MALPQVTETDYRAWLAFLWTLATFGIIGVMLFKGFTIDDALKLLAVLLPLDAVFIQSYFRAKE
jgi:hypothetical protein